MIDKRGGAGGKLAKGGKRVTVLRKGGGKVWEDQTLLEWNPSWFRLFVGDLSNDVSDDVLANAFNKYTSFQKARVIRDRLSQKAKYGFVAFSDPEDFLKAWKEMDGKYVGNRPVKLKKADDVAIRPVEIGHRKAKKLEQDRKKNKHRPGPY
ncbi:RNA-binding domain-containing protein [Pluteus cervinus]|uniref:RNA-binding domain-containing protein n=1 Tax=Pluteus cervinus TaxID=181527 RepID=A0ACD3BDE2_9AGAR|nr:RNA-binding domain-containing protein [Pluteus cervinus]